MIPQELHLLFWEIDIDIFEPQSYPKYTIARILEYGNPAAVSWLEAHFSTETIQTVIRAERNLSPKSATFWALVYRIPIAEVAALT